MTPDATSRSLGFVFGLALARRRAGGAAAGAVDHLLRPYVYTDLLAEADTVWCATARGGLLRYDRGTGTFQRFTARARQLASNR